MCCTVFLDNRSLTLFTWYLFGGGGGEKAGLHSFVTCSAWPGFGLFFLALLLLLLVLSLQFEGRLLGHPRGGQGEACRGGQRTRDLVQG